MTKIIYCPPGYDPTQEEFPIPGPSWRNCLVIFLLGAGLIILVGGFITAKIAAAQPPKALPTLSSLPTETATRTPENTRKPTIAYTYWAASFTPSPVETETVAPGYSETPTLSPTPSATLRPSKTPTRKPTAKPKAPPRKPAGQAAPPPQQPEPVEAQPQPVNIQPPPKPFIPGGFFANPTETPAKTLAPSHTPIGIWTATPQPTQAASPTILPATALPTEIPASATIPPSVTPLPTDTPTEIPSATPQPTATASNVPTATMAPSQTPTQIPTTQPTGAG